MRSILKVLLTALPAYLCHPAFPQPVFRGSVISVDVIDRGLMLSAEHIVIKARRLYGNIRMGYGGFSNGQQKIKSIPAGIVFFNQSDRHHLHFGAVMSLVEYNSCSQIQSSRNGRDKGLYLAPLAGYRFQQARGGMFFKLELMFSMKVHQFGEPQRYRLQWLHHAAMGVGYFFTHKKSPQ